MKKERVIQIHNFIMQNDLLLEVELNTKLNYFGRGSRASYYTAVQKMIAGQGAGLIGSLMVKEAEQIMESKQEMAVMATN